MRILIGADLVPTNTNVEYFENGNTEYLLGKELKDILKQADFRIFNLEVPLTDREKPISKCGPNLIAPTAAVNGYSSMGVDLLTLANNHILDQGDTGLFSTIKTLNDNNITHLGAGADLASARKPHIIQDGDKKIGIYACAEHEFTIADTNKPGANPFDALESLDHIVCLKKECDYVIVLYHGGKEHYRYPSPRLQKVCRKICEKGADLVVCQHSHCVGCEEKWGDSTIVYGQGNFLFDRSNSEFWQTALLISLDTDDGNIEYIPLQKEENTVRCPKNGDKILSEFHSRSEEIKKDGFVRARYEELAKEMKREYLMKVCGYNIWFRILNKLTRQRIKYEIPRSRELAIKNVIDCEAHSELFSTGLED